ncbi:two-component system sensor histidine kinase NtrB [Sulfidibacter corallicola]|uniref:histidine kinase n=1 Tax=Sulfidibacter corallicola TaxID=2818388 RepID=A0A8A4TIP4_SULCO|nr:PAS domain-containing sensor histidine kinase [Sulfidibacter corallicola]QTD48721.1 PAS domain S-box protein [Sulfidibacter corallicola]
METGFRLLFESLDEALLLLDGNQRIRRVNRASESVTGISISDMEGAPFADLFFPLEDSALEQRRPFSLTRDLQFPNREASIYSFRIKPLPALQDRIDSAWLVHFRDEGALSKLHQERDRLMEMATLNDILPTFLHELKNPLASVMAIAELMLEELPAGANREAMEGILHETRRMKLAFEGLGNLSRNLSCSTEHHIGLALMEACGIFQPLFERLSIDFQVDVAPLPPLPLQVGGIRGILFNLLTNAKQACKAGDRVTVEAGMNESGNVFRFSVTDTGVGMPPEVAAHCTDLFFTTKPMGSGIGMALCRTALSKLDGKLGIESEPGKGTRVSAEIPIQRSHERSTAR